MDKLKVGIAGGEGSFSQEAAEEYVRKNNLVTVEKIYFKENQNVRAGLRTLNLGQIDKMVFPIENSNGGIVYESVYAMSEVNFEIEEIFEIDVRHYLQTKPGKKVSDINKISSHQQALKQCRMYLKRTWPETELEEYFDTAGAARDLMAGKLDENTAVIAPKGCSELYGTAILDENIQDLKFNFTTFVVATRRK